MPLSTLELLLTGLKIAQAHAVLVPSFFTRKLTLAGEYLRWLCDAEGNLPKIGDDDSGCVFGAYHKSDSYAASVLGVVSSVTCRADLVPPFLQAHLRQAVFGFAPAPDFTPYGARCFPHGGMTIGRHKSAQGDIMFAFDHGYLGYLSIAAHGHADALSVWLHIDGQPLFVDAGNYLYHSQQRERRHFRGSAAHNTLTIAGADSSTMSGNFNWSHKSNVVLRSFTPEGSFWQAEAEQDGYLDTYHTIHRRTVERVANQRRRNRR